MDELQFQRYMRWRFRRMGVLRSFVYMARMYWALLRGKFTQFIHEDAQSLDKSTAMNYNELQRRAAR